ncbi:MAG TPA: PAS domain-containing sensor histidine kinase [Verrucomicrobiae bacterium]|jgi:PAS domain S-box-containing protein
MKGKSSKHDKSRPHKPGHWVSDKKFAQLQDSLREAQETLEAIRSGEVDAVVVSGPKGNHIYSLTGADLPYRVYVERMQEGAVTISAEGFILYANRRFAEMVNQPLEQVISARMPGFLNNGTWEKIHSVFKNPEKVIKCEALLQPSDRAYMPVNLTASNLPLEGQNVLCLVVTDLSAQKQNEELRMAKEVAEKANTAKDNFLAALSHELRTPLNPVLLLASEAAKDDELPERIRADFVTIRDNIELEARLIDDLLDLNRIAHGKMTLNTATVDCHAVLNRAIEMIKPDLDQKKISMITDFAKNQVELMADETRLQQVFWNVLKNAVKFTPGKGIIKVVTAIDIPSNRIAVKISDTGIGMTPEELHRAFDAFVQGKHAQDGLHRFGGLGLGLAISKMLITLHEGEISADSQGRGKGATFTVRLPLHRLSESKKKNGR